MDFLKIKNSSKKSVGILYFDMSYTLQMIKERNLHQVLEARHLGGFFSRVVSVHPLAGLFEKNSNQFGKPVVKRLKKSHLFVEGKIGVSKKLRWLPLVNLLLAQAQLFVLTIKISKKFKVSVVRVGDPYFLGILGLLSSYFLRVPLTVRVNANYDLQYQETKKPVYPKLFRFRQLEKNVERFVFPRCALVAGANKNNLNYAIANGARPSAGAIFPYGNLIHPIHFRNPANRPSAADLLRETGLPSKFLITVARLEPGKKIDHALHVINLLKLSGKKIGLCLVGEGSLRKKMENFVKTHKLKSLVYFAGNRSQEWIGRILPKASAVISPHMGRALVEACLAARPIIAYDFEWQKEIINHGKTGELVQENDWKAMAWRVIECLKSPDKSSKMGRAARKMVLKKMNPSLLTKQEISAYKKILGL